MLSTNHLDDERAFQTQTKWLRETLESIEGTALYIIACFHVSPFGPDYNPNNVDAMKSQEGLIKTHWIPLFERHGVRLVISGHKHVYARDLHDGTWYQIIGSFQGVRKYPVRIDKEDGHLWLNKHAIIDICVERDGLTVRAIDLFGRVFDSYKVNPMT